METIPCSCRMTGAISPLSAIEEDAQPADFRELAASDLSIVIQDPRSSTPGLGLLMWVKSAYGDEAAAIWEGLADNIVTVTPGWSEAYGLFLEGEADLVLSYTTSPAYHMIAEEDDSKVALPFREGHYMQIEVAGKLAATDQPETGRSVPALHDQRRVPGHHSYDQLDVSRRDARGRFARGVFDTDPARKGHSRPDRSGRCAA